MLLRYRGIDRAFCLAEKINVKDLFMDLHFAALECNEKTLAQKAQELASNLLVSSSLIAHLRVPFVHTRMLKGLKYVPPNCKGDDPDDDATGGNATLIGASANVVCAGIAEQNGYKITFKDFMKIGMPVMITTVFSAMVYLLIVHIGFGWNITACPLT
eukprot:Em0016g693a